jgi:hypothetical protein
MYSSKKHFESIPFLSTFDRKMAFSAIFKPNSAGNHPFTPPPGHSPANSQCTKQFLSCPRIIELFLSEGAERLNMAVA